MKRLIVLDGLDGSGKSTQYELLQTWLRQRGVACRPVSFPDYDSPASAPVRMYLAGTFGTRPEDVNAYAASSFYAVDRYASYRTQWQKDYQAGTLILAARYTTSNAIHQMAKLPDDQKDEYLRWLEEYEYLRLQLPRPDLVLFLDVEPQVAEQLLRRRYEGDETKKDIHEKNMEYLRACRQSALYAAEKCGWHVIRCTAGGAMRPMDDISREIRQHVLPLIEKEDPS